MASEPDRRAVLVGAAGASALLATGAAAKAHAREINVSPAADIKITGIESFDIQLPSKQGNQIFLPTYRGMTPGRSNVVRISTDAGVAGYSFLGATR